MKKGRRANSPGGLTANPASSVRPPADQRWSATREYARDDEPQFFLWYASTTSDGIRPRSETA